MTTKFSILKLVNNINLRLNDEFEIQSVSPYEILIYSDKSNLRIKIEILRKDDEIVYTSSLFELIKVEDQIKQYHLTKKFEKISPTTDDDLIYMIKNK